MKSVEVVVPSRLDKTISLGFNCWPTRRLAFLGYAVWLGME